MHGLRTIRYLVLGLFLGCGLAHHAIAQTFLCRASGGQFAPVETEGNCTAAANQYCSQVGAQVGLNLKPMHPQSATLDCPSPAAGGIGIPTGSGQTGSCSCSQASPINRYNVFSLTTTAVVTPCTGKAGQDEPSELISGALNARVAVLQGCFNGCRTLHEVTMCGQNGTGNQTDLWDTKMAPGQFRCWSRPGYYTGYACGGNTAANTSPVTDTASVTKDPAGTCYGEINGQKVSYPCAGRTSTEYTRTVSTITSSSTLTIATSPTAIERVTTECVRGQCTTTTNSDNKGQRTQTTTVEAQEKYCERNPKDALCKNFGDSQFGGTCAAGFTCSGDAAQCATARGVWEARCKLNDFTGDANNPIVQQGTQAMTGNDPSTHPKNNKETISSATFNTTNLLGSSQCPADQVIANGRITVPLSGMCSYMQMLGLLLVGLSMFVAARLVIEGV